MPFASADFKARWSCQAAPFVTLKILTNGFVEKYAASTELEISRCIARTDPKSEGVRYLRTALNSFEVSGPDSTLVALVYAPHERIYFKIPKPLSEWSNTKLFFETIDSNGA